MFDGLIDSLDGDKWETVDSETKPAEFAEYSVNRHHKNIDATCLGIMIAFDDGDPINVQLKDVLPKKDPLKAVAHAELLIKDCEIIGIDLDGDCVMRKDK